jgi:hypothetical protein
MLMIERTMVPDSGGEAWLLRLKSAYEAGFYRTESAAGEQIAFPWQGKTCRDCPFWAGKVCRYFGERRSGLAHTCCQFDRALLPQIPEAISVGG